MNIKLLLFAHNLQNHVSYFLAKYKRSRLNCAFFKSRNLGQDIKNELNIVYKFNISCNMQPRNLRLWPNENRDK